MVVLMQLRPGFMGMAHGTDPSHRVHDLAYGFLFATAALGIFAQLRTPARNGAGMLMALMPWVALLLVAVLSSDARVILSMERISVGLLTAFAALLHPTGSDLFRSFRQSRVDRLMVALVLVAAVPLLAFASTNIALQKTGIDDHGAMGHYGFMAAFSFTVIGVGVLASVRLDGWRLAAWVSGLLPALLGLVSLVFPVSSSFNPVWALSAIAWGVVFIAVAERSSRSASSMTTA
jgi:hypothetical protein